RLVLIASLAAAAGAAFWGWEKRVELFLVPRAWSEVVKRWEALRELESAAASTGSSDLESEWTSLQESFDQAMRDLLAIQRPDFPSGESFSLTLMLTKEGDDAYFAQCRAKEKDDELSTAVFALDPRGRLLGRAWVIIRYPSDDFPPAHVWASPVSEGRIARAIRIRGAVDADRQVIEIHVRKRFAIDRSGVVPLGSWTRGGLRIPTGSTFLSISGIHEARFADMLRSSNVEDLHRALTQLESAS